MRAMAKPVGQYFLLFSILPTGICGCAHTEGVRAPTDPPLGETPRCAPAIPSSRPAFELVVLGSGGPRAFGRASPGYVIVVDGTPRLLVDAGPGSFVRIGEMRIDFRKLDTVLLTHLHIDHSGELPGILKSTYDIPNPFHVFGPEGAGAYPSTRTFIDLLFGPHGAFAYLPSFRNGLRFIVTRLPRLNMLDDTEPLSDGSRRRSHSVVGLRDLSTPQGLIGASIRSRRGSKVRDLLSDWGSR